MNYKNWIKVHLKHSPIKIYLRKHRGVFLTEQHSTAETCAPCSDSRGFVIHVKKYGLCDPNQEEKKVHEPTEKDKKKKTLPAHKKIRNSCLCYPTQKDKKNNTLPAHKQINNTCLCYTTQKDKKKKTLHAHKKIKNICLCYTTQKDKKNNTLPASKKIKNTCLCYTTQKEKKKICKHCGSETGCKGNPKKNQAKGDISAMDNDECAMQNCNETIEDAKKTINDAVEEGMKTLNEGKITILEARNTIVNTFKYNLTGCKKKKKSVIKDKRITKSKKR